ncbi:MAG: ABC transporter substrate-binding protein [Betaproteobacteria bacterium]|nr:ABC transporter substrate-binding protein [Betaproteobacteria bacterium]
MTRPSSLRLVAALAAFAAVPALAANLTIGLGTDVTSIDPHFHNLTPNNNVAQHLYGYLVGRNEKSQPEPGLATEWKTIDPLTWEFKLRRGVKFHDGSDFTAADVVASIERVPKVPKSPSPFTAFTRQIKSIDVVDPHTIRFRTATPYPLMPSDLQQVAIINKAHVNASTEDFNSGKAAIGTGPYKLVRYAKSDRVELARNDAWWGGKTPWEKVTLRILPQDAPRVAALLSGDVQVIENVPTADVAKLKTNKQLTMVRIVADRLIYLHLDSDRDVSPFVTDKAGQPMQKNPLKDPRVRKALSKLINRPAIVSRVMEGEAIAAGQLVPEFLFGATKTLQVEKFDPEGAKKLLAEAGWPDGFGLTIHTPNNRYVNDEQVAQAVAQMLSRGGIPTKVVAMPSATYFTQATDLKFSLMLLGWGTGTGEASSSLKALLMTFSRDKGYGTANRGRYSNTKVDALTEDALQTVDDVKREAYLQRATEIAINDTGVIPLHFQVNLWAARDGIVYQPRLDEQTLAHKMKPRG